MNRLLTEIHERLLDGLAAAIGPDGSFDDALVGRPSHSTHYGHCAAALALAIRRPENWALALRPVRAWLGFGTGDIGHLPFNRLMLSMLRRIAAERGAPAEDMALVDAGLKRCRLERAYPSNNWTLLAQTCRLVEAPDRERARETAAFCALLERWTTRAGGFIDFPTDPDLRGRFSTPVAYHHKALFLAALAARHHPDPPLLRHLGRMLEWLVHCWDPAGYAGGLGRSNHALFGDACLLAALILLGQDEDSPAGPVGALAHRLAAQQRPDGLLWLDPAGPASGNAAWDRYMYLSVYNAWTGALIGLARHLGPLAPGLLAEHGVQWRAGRDGCFHDREAGLLCLRAQGGTLIVATRGQAPQSFSRDEVELRYAGGTILHLTGPDGQLHVGPPCRTTRAHLQENPALAGWTPLLEIGGRLYAVSDFAAVDVQETGSGVTIRLTGHPAALTREAPPSVWRRAVSVIDWRLLGGRLGRYAALRRPLHRGVKASLNLAVSMAGPEIRWELVLEVAPGATIRYLNPAGYLLAGPRDHESGWLRAAPPSSLPGASARSRPPMLLPPGTHHMSLELRWDGGRWRAGFDSGENDATQHERA